MEAATKKTFVTEHESGLLIGLREEFGQHILVWQETCDGIPTIWIDRQHLLQILTYFRDRSKPRFEMLFDITAIDERVRVHREGQPQSDFSVVYHLMSFQGNQDFRIKVPLTNSDLNIPTIVGLWPAANWYERETWDMFGITFEGHPNLYRIVLPPTWEGHALRKEHPARATEMEPFSLEDDKAEEEQLSLIHI